MPTRPVRKPSKKPRLQSASARYICDRRPGGKLGGDNKNAAPLASADLGSACDHLPDRGLAVGPSRADRGVVRGAVSTPRLKAIARPPDRYAFARHNPSTLHPAALY